MHCSGMFSWNKTTRTSSRTDDVGRLFVCEGWRGNPAPIGRKRKADGVEIIKMSQHFEPIKMSQLCAAVPAPKLDSNPPTRLGKNWRKIYVCLCVHVTVINNKISNVFYHLVCGL